MLLGINREGVRIIRRLLFQIQSFFFILPAPQRSGTLENAKPAACLPQVGILKITINLASQASLARLILFFLHPAKKRRDSQNYNKLSFASFACSPYFILFISRQKTAGFSKLQ
jgi:hypothetical protein